MTIFKYNTWQNINNAQLYETSQERLLYFNIKMHITFVFNIKQHKKMDFIKTVQIVIDAVQ